MRLTLPWLGKIRVRSPVVQLDVVGTVAGFGSEDDTVEGSLNGISCLLGLPGDATRSLRDTLQFPRYINILHTIPFRF